MSDKRPNDDDEERDEEIEVNPTGSTDWYTGIAESVAELINTPQMREMQARLFESLQPMLENVAKTIDITKFAQQALGPQTDLIARIVESFQTSVVPLLPNLEQLISTEGTVAFKGELDPRVIQGNASIAATARISADATVLEQPSWVMAGWTLIDQLILVVLVLAQIYFIKEGKVPEELVAWVLMAQEVRAQKR